VLAPPSPRDFQSGSHPAAAQERLPAVVVGGADNGGGLGLVRSLGRGGVPVIAVDCDPAAPALLSRFARKVVMPELSGPSFVRNLMTLASSVGSQPVLFLTTDEAVVTVSEHRAELATRYRIRLPDHDSLTALMRKSSFQQLAEGHGFAVPRSVPVRTIADIGMLAGLRFPVVIKPSVKTENYQARQFSRGYRVSSCGEAEKVCRDILPILPDLVAQEWIEGSDSELYFCLQYRGAEGALASFTGRKLSIWPPDVGTTASCVAAAEAHAELHRLTDAFFRATSFVGMGGMEFKRDKRTGEFFMIEPTVGRVDWQEEVATLNGMNIPLAAYLHESADGMPFITTAMPPTIWRDTARHWKSRDARAGETQPKARVYDAYWRLDDPWPALFHMFGLFMRLLRRGLQQLEPRWSGKALEKA
jgi:predicted ATP-grasp superfamily ATP-dependent carboligase